MFIAKEKEIVMDNNIYSENFQTERQRKREAKKKKLKKIIIVLMAVIIVIGVSGFVLAKIVIMPNCEYNRANKLMRKGKYEEAITIYNDLDGYKDSDDKLIEAKYNLGIVLKNEGKYQEAITIFELLGDYNDSKEKIDETKYFYGILLKNDKKYVEAISIFELLDGYKDSEEKIIEVKYEAAVEDVKLGKYDSAMEFFELMGDYKDCKEKIIEIKYLKAVETMNSGDFSNAKEEFLALGDYKDCEGKIIEINYSEANLLIKDKKYEDAIDALKKLGDYKDSKEKINYLSNILSIKNANVDDFITFGTYEQDTHRENGKEKIEWFVIAKQDGRLLVRSTYALTFRPFNDKLENVTWETCSLRKWLNEDFFNSAFSEEEQAMIPTVTLKADRGSGNDTEDRVFLFSETEYDRYGLYCMCEATAQAIDEYGDARDENSYRWWLRNSGSSLQDAVTYNGGLRDATVTNGGYAVLPVMWIDIDS